MVRKFERRRAPAKLFDPLGDVLVRLIGQHALDDLERGVVRVAASLDEARLEAGRVHRRG